MPSINAIELKMTEVRDFQPFFFAMPFLGSNSSHQRMILLVNI